jgi:hypothetical protein
VSLTSVGGEIESSDHHLRIEFPRAALLAPATITVTPSQKTGAIGDAYDVTGTTQKLTSPALVTIHYAGIDLAGASPQSLRVGTYVHDRWQALAGYTFDASTQTITATTTVLAPLAITVDPLVCLSRSGTTTNGGTLSGGTSSSSGGSSGGGVSTPPGPSPVTCAQLNPCSDVPTATKTDCEIESDGTWNATCCYDPHVPYCWQFGGGSSGGSSGGGLPSPSCAADAKCDDGASLQSCTEDVPGSFEATCCYPPGVLPTSEGTGNTTSSSSGGGSGSGSGGASNGGT